jgi:3-dehydroquinate synthase
MIVPIHLENSGVVEYNVTIDKLPKLSFDTKVAVITNPTISGLHLDKLLSQIKVQELHIITVPDGEEYKRLDTVVDILDELFTHKLDRKSLLIAFGGGVIGDMTGFTASIYQRGIGFIQIPTTLLSQVDASVGGKTGVNNRFGKNLIGAFYQPKAVYIDTDFLDTLPSREFSAGMAELIKMSIMFDAEFFNFLQIDNLSTKDSLAKAIARSVELKAWVVNQDEKEAGIRAVLNYGHTFGHVIENETGYKTYLHGEAVAIGMVMANVLANILGLMSQDDMDKVKELLVKHNLPVDYKIKDVESFYNKFFLDKKSANDKIKFILPNSIGNFETRVDIDKSIVIEALSKFSGIELI